MLVYTQCASAPKGSALSPFAQSLHTRWQESARVNFSNITTQRRAEDQQAMQLLGAQSAYARHTDCIYRQSPIGEWLYASEQAIFGSLAQIELQQLGQLVDEWEKIPGLDENTRIYAPLAIGNHIDHQWVNATVRTWQARRAQIWFYEDFPYASISRRGNAWQARVSGWVCARQPLFERCLQMKAQAMQAYVSQFSSFWDSPEALQAEIGLHAIAFPEWGCCERFWQMRPVR